MLTAEAVIFAIHSAIKLGGALKKAYANSLRGKEIVLPLPSVDMELDLDVANRFFRLEEGQPFVKEIERLEELHQIAESDEGIDSMTSGQKKEYENYYIHFFKLTNGVSSDGGIIISSEDLVGLLRIRQWEQGTVKGITPLKMISGTLVEIGIDYFNMVPGAIRSGSSHAKILKSFLGSINDVDFVSEDSLKETITREVVPKMFISIAESIDELSSNLTDDEKLLTFIHSVGEGLTNDIHRRIEAMDTGGNQEEVKQWGQVLFRSLVKNSGTYVFNSPENIFETNESQSALIQSVGNSLMSAVLDENDAGIDFKNVFTVETLDNIVKSSLAVVAQYPSLVSDKNGIKQVIVDVANAVSSSGIKKPGLVPELAQLVLVSTAGNLQHLWKTGDDTAEHLLVTTLQQVLLALGADSNNGPWRPKLTNQQILAIAENTFSEVIQNKAWIEDKVNDKSLLGEVLNTTFNALGTIPEGKRLNFDTLESIIQINLRTVAASKLVLNKVKWGSDQQETTILNKSLDLIFAFVFEDDSHKEGDRITFLFDLLDYTMDTIVSQHPDERGLLLVQLLLNANSGVIEVNGFNPDLADSLAKASLEVISANPDLLSNDKALQNIITGVAGAFQSSGIKQPGLLGEFIRLALVHSSSNLNLLIPVENGDPKQLAVLALQNIIDAFTVKPGSGKWRPKLTGNQLLTLSESILDEVVRNPHWITDKTNQNTLLKESLDTTFDILEKYQEGQRVNFDTLQEIVELVLSAVAINKLILKPDSQQETILQKMLDLTFDFVFKEPDSVDKSDLMIDILEYTFESIIIAHPNDQGITIMMSLLQKNLGIVTSTGINEELANHFVSSALIALSEHPELVSEKIGVQNIVVGVTSTLANSNIREPGIVNEFVRLIIENTAGNLNLVIDTSKRTEKNILVAALSQILSAISKRPSSGKWKPVLTPMQTYQITELILEEIVENPRWIKNNLIQTLMGIVYKSMEKIPKDKPTHHSTFETLIMKAIDAVDSRMNLAVKIVTTDDGVQKIALTYALEGFFEAIFDTSGGEVAAWTLTQTKTLNVIIHYYLLFLTGQPIDIPGMDKAINIIRKAVEDLNNDILFKVDDLIEKLDLELAKIDISD